jgi:hypothetical protein
VYGVVLSTTIIEKLGSPFVVSSSVGLLAGVADTESTIPLLLLDGMTTPKKRDYEGF